MRSKFTLLRSDSSTDDIIVSFDATATVGDLASAIARCDPRSPIGREVVESTRFTLQAYRPGASQPDVIPPTRFVDEAALGSGLTVALVAAPPGSRGGRGQIDLVASGGADDGAVFTVDIEGGIVGRSPDCAVQLSDTAVSKRHARIELVDGGVQVVDLNSANGLIVDGGVVPRVILQEGESVVVGETELTVTRILEPDIQSDSDARIGATVEFVRSPRVEPRFPGEVLPAPEPPAEPEPVPFPWLIMIAPMLMGGILFAVTGSVLSIAFIALSPILMVSNWLSGRATRRRRFKNAVARFEAQLDDLGARLVEGQAREIQARNAEFPGLAHVISEAHRRGSLLWARRPEHWSFLNLRLGTGALRSRITVSEIGGREKSLPEFVNRVLALIETHRYVPDVPVIENLFDAGAVGVAGERSDVAAVARGYLAQLVATHSPAEISVAAVVGPEWATELSWLTWLPHSSSSQSPLGLVPHLADSPTSAVALVTAIESLIATRAPVDRQSPTARGDHSETDTRIVRAANVGSGESGPEPPDADTPALILVIGSDAPLDRGRLIQLSESAAEAGVYPIWIGGQVTDLPAVCRTFVDLAATPGPAVGLVRSGQLLSGVAVDRLDLPAAEAFARSLAPVVDAGAVELDSSDLPRSVSMLSLIGPELAESSDAVIDRWRQNNSILDRSAEPTGRHRPGKLRALVGQGGSDALHLDLRSQGPHALVGGTTGSGKSEFLQSWVLGMAAEYSPDRVTFLFVDYKGGSAFADCVNLPHCVGLVTDLSPHLVRRALTSLRAELRHREHLFNRKKAKDILDLEKRRDPETPPALVIVIDEFAALVSDVPEFVDGIVDVAQRGRSLGIHLIMATQRPAGVIKDNLRANTNLRIALRMADEMDSQDVLGTSAAATFDPSIPGRAAVKSGHGRIANFQSAYAGGWTTDEPASAEVIVEELRFGTPVRWQDPAEEAAAAVVQDDPGPTDQTRLVTAIQAASRSAAVPEPRKPWMPELSRVYDMAQLRQRSDDELVIGVADDPENQAQSTVYFRPDDDGHLIVYGTSGSGKSVALRTLAIAAGITPRGGPVHVYGLDFGSGALTMLQSLPHVGSIIQGDDSERVIRLLRMIRAELDRRSSLFAAAQAGTITEYRRRSASPDEPRILLLIDGYPGFRAEYEVGSARAPWYQVFQQVMTDGRPLGIHVVLTADRSASVPSSVASNASRRLTLRLADEAGYALLDVPSDVLGPASPPGRAVIDGLEIQVAVFGGSASVAEQAAAIDELASATGFDASRTAASIASLPTVIPTSELPAAVDGLPVLGVSDTDLAPTGLEPTRTLLLAGPPGSGRTNATAAIARAVHRWDPAARFILFAGRRSPLRAILPWEEVADDIESAAELAKRISAQIVAEERPYTVVVIESLADYLSTPADAPLVELIKAVRRSDHFLVAESETSTWASSWPLLAEMKSGRRGVLLQPEGLEGEQILRTSIPRANRSDFPVGRGYVIESGRAVLVQLPLVDTGEASPSTRRSGAPTVTGEK